MQPAAAARARGGDVQRHRGEALAVDRQALADGELGDAAARPERGAAGMERQRRAQRRHVLGAEHLAQRQQHRLRVLVRLAQLGERLLQRDDARLRLALAGGDLAEQRGMDALLDAVGARRAGQAQHRRRRLGHQARPPGGEAFEVARRLVRQRDRGEAFARRQLGVDEITRRLVGGGGEDRRGAVALEGEQHEVRRQVDGAPARRLGARDHQLETAGEETVERRALDAQRRNRLGRRGRRLDRDRANRRAHGAVARSRDVM